MTRRVAAKGTWGTVEWAMAANGQEPGYGFFLTLTAPDQAKVLALFQMLAESGRILNREKFKSLGAQGLHLFEFKSFQIRFIGNFRPGHRFLVAHGLRKKKDELEKTDIWIAARIMQESDQSETDERGR